MARDSSSTRTELRVELPAEELAVLDGWCSGRGEDRTKVIRRILREWSVRELHAATVLLRVAGRNPTTSEPGRDDDGRRAA